MLTESWVEGKSVEEKCTTNRENCSLMRNVKLNRFKNLGELHKEWTEAGVKASRAPHTDVSRNLATVVIGGVLPGLKRRRTGLLPSDQKSSFQMRASFVFHLETKVLEAVDQHSTGHNQQPDQLYAKRKCVELRETNGGHTRYWLVFVRDGLSRQRRSAH